MPSSYCLSQSLVMRSSSPSPKTITFSGSMAPSFMVSRSHSSCIYLFIFALLSFNLNNISAFQKKKEKTWNNDEGFDEEFYIDVRIIRSAD